MDVPTASSSVRPAAPRGIAFKSPTRPTLGNGLQPGFDPQAYPILARHWFVVAVLPRDDGAGQIDTAEIETAEAA